MKCVKCKDSLEPIYRNGNLVFNFCRVCKLPHNEQGYAEIKFGLFSNFNQLNTARDIIKNSGGNFENNAAQNAMEIFLIKSLMEAYIEGMKDGTLLAHSLDVSSDNPEEHNNGHVRSTSRDPK